MAQQSVDEDFIIRAIWPEHMEEAMFARGEIGKYYEVFAYPHLIMIEKESLYKMGRKKQRSAFSLELHQVSWKLFPHISEAPWAFLNVPGLLVNSP